MHAIELAGIIVDPRDQQRGLGQKLVAQTLEQYNPDGLIAYTRNPAILKIAGQVSGLSDVLTHSDPALIAGAFPEVTVHDGILYHIDRYAPDGLYGDFDPANREYGGVPLKERAQLLENPNHALIVAVDLKGEKQ